MNEEGLRVSLDEMMLAETQSVFEQRFAEIKKQFTSCIKILPESKERLKTYNCFAYALSIACLSQYQDLVEKYRDSTLANSTFVSYILSQNGLEKITEQDASCDDIVLYYDNDTLKHGGKISDAKRIHSKWGPNELFKHGLWEVPASYGNKIKFFRQANTEKIIDLLEVYCLTFKHN